MKAIWFLEEVVYLINTIFWKVNFLVQDGRRKQERNTLLHGLHTLIKLHADQVLILSRSNRTVITCRHPNWTDLIWFLALPLIDGLAFGRQSDLSLVDRIIGPSTQILCQSTLQFLPRWTSLSLGAWPCDLAWVGSLPSRVNLLQEYATVTQIPGAGIHPASDTN